MRSVATGRVTLWRGPFLVWVGFALLCLLSASGWLVGDYIELPFSGLLRVCVHGLLLSAFSFAIDRTRIQPGSLRVMGWAAVLLGLPAVAVVASEGRVGGLTAVLVFSLVPAVTVFLVAQARAGFGDSGDSMRLLVPALAGVGGAGLLLPFAAPGSVVGWVWLGVLLAVAVAAAYAGIRLHGLLAGVPVARAAGLAAGSLALVAGGFLWLPHAAPGAISAKGVGVEVGVCSVDGLILWLTVWLLREMEPLAFSSRFLFVPLVTVVEGFVLMRPGATWTMAVGVLLVLGGGLVLVRGEPEQRVLKKL